MYTVFPSKEDEDRFHDIATKLHMNYVPLSQSEQSTMKRLEVPGNTLAADTSGPVVSTNPAHFLFGTHILFNIGLRRPSYEYLPMIDYVSLTAMPDPYMLEWNWGKTILSASLANWTFAHVAKRSISEWNLHRYEPESLTCFEGLYLCVDEFGSLLGTSGNIKDQRMKFLVALEKDLKANADIKVQLSSGLDDPIHTRCHQKSLVIAIWIREKSSRSRHFTNLPQVIQLAQNHTKHPVQLITGNDSVSLVDQFNIFNSFDILITTAGSQLANMVLINRENVGFVEVGTVVRDDFWATEARKFGMQYIQVFT